MGTSIVEFHQTLGGRGLSPTWFSSCLRTIQMVGVFGAGKAVCLGPSEWDRKLEILGCFRQSKLGLETAFGWSDCVCDDLDSSKLKCRIFSISPCELILCYCLR